MILSIVRMSKFKIPRKSHAGQTVSLLNLPCVCACVCLWKVI